MSFKDQFSGHAAEYAQFRPRYPATLFEYLSSLAPDRECAWDCATGNGQAAVSLAEHFDCVVATDASGQQIENAVSPERVEYRIAPAEGSGLERNCVALVTVAQALHWFDISAFFEEATRVLKPNGVVAVWAYNLMSISPEIDARILHFYRSTTGPYWPPEREIVEAGYRTIDFPFAELTAPAFEMETRWTLEQVLGYLRTWSATKKFGAERGFDPVNALAAELGEVWLDPTVPRLVRWPLSMRVGRVPKQ